MIGDQALEGARVELALVEHGADAQAGEPGARAHVRSGLGLGDRLELRDELVPREGGHDLGPLLGAPVALAELEPALALVGQELLELLESLRATLGRQRELELEQEESGQDGRGRQGSLDHEIRG